MNKDFSQTPRPTFKRALRRISVISVVISMTLVWLLQSTASIFTLKQYAQKNLELTAATMGRSLEAALVFGDSAAAEETLASLGKARADLPGNRAKRPDAALRRVAP